jgi:RecA/RadA recombinase
MSVALRKVASHANKCGCTIIFINQLRYKVRGGHTPGSRSSHQLPSPWGGMSPSCSTRAFQGLASVLADIVIA